MLLLKILFLLLSLGGAIYLAWKKPQGLIYLLPVAIALEISRTWYPGMELFHNEEGTFSLTRIVTVAILFAAALDLWKKRELRARLWEVIRHPLTWAFAIYIVIGAFSSIYSVNRVKTLVEVVRLFSLLLLMIGIATIARKENAKTVMKVVHTTGVLLVPFALYEFFTRKFLWFEYFADWNPPRVNATFVDPNIFARYLILAIVANLVLQTFQPGERKKLLYPLCLIGLLGALVVTFSRAGLVTLAIVMLAMALVLSVKEVFRSLGLLGAGVVTAFIARPSLLQRFMDIKSGLADLDPGRKYLGKAALAMFQDHPVLGVGMGGFQKSFITNYSWLKTLPEGPTLSHTTLLTITAELGALGVLALLGVFLSIIKTLKKLRNSRYYSIGAGYLVWILTVFTSSQFEARFFEDPTLWLSAAMILVLDVQDRISF